MFTPLLLSVYSKVYQFISNSINMQYGFEYMSRQLIVRIHRRFRVSCSSSGLALAMTAVRAALKSNAMYMYSNRLSCSAISSRCCAEG